MRAPSYFLILLFLLATAACAQLPDVDGDVLRARAEAGGGQDTLAVMREEGEKIAGIRFVDGNKVTLLLDGAATYPTMLAAIRKAKKRIDMESFMFDDSEGKRFAAVLIAKRRAGVEVNLIYDAIGSDDTSEALFNKMRASGIRLVEYNPVDPGSIIDSSFNHRDHRKLLIVDGAVAFTGGVNISALYRLKLKIKKAVGADGDEGEDAALDPEKTPWRDTHVMIAGPVVAEFEKFYAETWRAQHGHPVPAPPPTPQTRRGDLWVQAIDGTPDLGRYTIYRSLIAAIAVARQSVHLTTAFFVPTPDLTDALEDAARRGVDVTLILPSQSSSDLSLHAGHGAYEDLMEAGVKIFERQNVILHAKTAVIDGVWSTIGSSNLDWRSVLFNNECDAVILGGKFGGQMETMFRNDLAQSKRIDPEAWADRPLLEKLQEWKAETVEYFL